MAGLLTLITTGAGVAGTIITASTEVRLVIAGLAATSGLLATLQAYNDGCDVKYMKAALQGLLASLPGPDLLRTKTMRAVRRLAERQGYVLCRSRSEPNGDTLYLMVRRGSADISAAYFLDSQDRSEISSAYLDGAPIERILDRRMFGDDREACEVGSDDVSFPAPLQKIKSIAQLVFYDALRDRGLNVGAQSRIRLCPLGVSVRALTTPPVAIELDERFIKRVMETRPAERYAMAYTESNRQMERVEAVSSATTHWRPPGLLTRFG
jgi:hypothetical protein